jgi:hypothetical protein
VLHWHAAVSAHRRGEVGDRQQHVVAVPEQVNLEPGQRRRQYTPALELLRLGKHVPGRPVEPYLTFAE